MKKAVTPVVAFTLILLTIIVIFGVFNFWFGKIIPEEQGETSVEILVDCDQTYTITNLGHPTQLGPIIIEGRDKIIEKGNLQEIKIVSTCSK